MLKNFKLPEMSLAPGAWKEPRVLVRAGLGVLLFANMIAAGFAFNIFGTSPESVDVELNSARIQLRNDQQRLNRSRLVTGKIDKGRADSDTFLASYVSDRRHTYSTIISEITEAANKAGMKMEDTTIAPLDPIEGSADLDMMTLSINFQGGYGQLVRFVNLLDRSPRFLIIESMQAAPQPKGDVLTVNLKLNAFVRETPGGEL